MLYCGTVFSPTFWTTKRLASVTTQVRSGGSYSDVERWTLTHTFPDPGDGTRAGLWLSKIAHAGLVGTTTTVPDIEFTGVQMPNRVDTIDFAAAMNWWRIAKIQTETGGTINVTYSGPDCVAGQTPTPETNTKRCYPSVWTPEGYTNPVTDWFHKYVVTTIYEQDNTGGVPPQGSPRVVHTYSYLDGAAWHYSDDDGLIEKQYKTWSNFRGYGRVAETTGDPGEQTYTETRYFRGMNGDRAAPSGGTKTVTVDGFADEDWFADMTREAKTFNGPSGAVVSRETSDPWGSAATASRTINGDTVTARFARFGTTRNYTTLDAARGERVTKTTTTFDSLGMAVQVDDFGEDGVSGDEQCKKIDYTPRNDTLGLMDKVHRTQTYAVQCSATTGTLTDADVISEERTSFDGQAFETAPTRGLGTKTEKMTAWNAGAPTFATVSQGAYDAYGRVTTAWDALNAKTTIAYTPATGGPVTAITVTNPLLHVATTTVNAAWGSSASIVDANNKRTDLAYDGLGRLAGVWLPGRDKATQSANATFDYLIRNDAATVVSTSRLNPAGAYNTMYALYDGLLRVRQTQSPSPSGDRLLTDTFYDTAGREATTFGSYHTTGTPGTTLVTATERALVPTQARTVFDGAGRPTASIFQPYDAERWRTSVYYAGDRADVTPPAGGTATSTLTDARDRTVSVRQYHGATPTPSTAGSWDTTSHAYNRKGQLTSVTDAMGNQWLYEYDLQGRRTKQTDPDNGVTTLGYDAADRLTLSTDARGKKLAYLYDPLGRKRAVYDNAVGGTMRAQWVYDTIAKGRLSQSTRFVGGAAYQTKIVGYTDQYQPTSIQVVIPTSETNLAGTYNFANTYNVDGSLASTSLPSTGGDLPAETLSYTYDTLGQATTMTSLYGATNLSYVAGTTYNALGELDQLTLDTDDTAGGRVWQAFTHELETGRLTGVRVDRDTVAPNTLSDVHYTYDNAGNITKAVDAAPDPVDDTQCFTHDYLRRLIDAWTPSNGDCATAPSATALGGPAPYWHSWSFDLVGNRKTQVVHTSVGDTTTNYAYPAAQAAQPHALSTTTTGALTQNYKYDESGNTICRPAGTTTNTCPSGGGSQTLTWDPEGHLETSADTTGTTTYIYDADGNRLVRRDPAGKTLYLPGQELRYTNSTGATTCTRYYMYGGSLVASRTGAGLTWLASDHQGTANVSVSATAAQTATVRRQNPYGNPRGGTPTWANDKGFIGGTIDNTGLTHLGAREYDPATGRFVSVDPIQDISDPQQWNGYAYSHNTPITSSDPTGLIDADCMDHDCRGYSPSTGCPGGCGTDANVAWGKSHHRTTTMSNRHDDRWHPDTSKGEHWTPESFSEFFYGTHITNAVQDHAVLTDMCKFVGEGCDGLDNGSPGVNWAHVADGAMAFVMIAAAPECLAVAIFCANEVGQQIISFYGHGGAGPGEGEAAVVEAGEVGGQAGLIGRSCRGNSFSPDTQVLMADGSTKAIKDVKVGDKVKAADPETGQVTGEPVTKLHNNHDTDFTDLTVTTAAGWVVVHTTQEHPFWDLGSHRWVVASELAPGTLLVDDAGRAVRVALVRNWSGHHDMRNLTVATLHTYYVIAGDTPVLVHNTGPCLGPVQNPSRGSTARRPHVDWEEDLLLEVRHNPEAGERLVRVPQTDPRWPADKGWQKMTQTIDGVEIHYQYQTTTGAVDDLKVKDWVPGAVD